MSEAARVKKLCKEFSEYFVTSFEDYITKCCEVLENKRDYLQTPEQLSSDVVQIGKEAVSCAGESFSPLKPIIEGFGNRLIRLIYQRANKKKASRFQNIAYESKSLQTKKANREILVEAAVDIFQSFEMQFTSITAKHGGPTRAMQKLAENCVDRIFECYMNNDGEDIMNISFMTNAVVDDKICASGRQIIINLTSEKNINTADLFTKVGIVLEENSKYYFKTLSSETKTYGYRRQFYSDNRLVRGQKLEPNKCKDYCYFFDKTNFKNIVKEVLEEFNEKDKDLLEGRIMDLSINNKNEIINAVQSSSIREDIIEYLRNTNNSIVEIKSLIGKKRSSVQNRSLRFHMREAVKSFTGRTAELENIHEILNSKKCLIVCGLGGIGKSDLVRQYACNYKEEYKSAIWFDAEKDIEVEKQFKLIANELMIATKTGDYEREFLMIVEATFLALDHEKTLIIFDNAVNLRIIHKYIPSDKFRNIKTIITSQNEDWGNKSCLKLDVLQKNDCINLVKNTLAEHGIMENKADDLGNLTKELGGLPLAMQQAIAYIIHENKIKTFTVKDYLDKLEPLKLLDRRYPKKSNNPFPDSSEMDYANTLFRTLKLTINRILEEDEGDLAIEILNVISYLPSDGEFKNLIIKYFAGNGNSPEAALYALKKYFLVTEETDNPDNSVLHIHRLVQMYVRSEQKFVNIYVKQAIYLTFKSDYLDSVLKQAEKYEGIIIKFFEETSDKGYLFYRLIEARCNESVEIILKEMSPNHEVINYHDDGNLSTPLHLSCKNNFISIVQLLLKNKNVIIQKNKEGDFPLHIAVQQGFIDIVREFVKFNISTNNDCGFDNRSLYYAGRYDHFDIAILLLENEIQNSDSTIENPLIGAIEGGNEVIVELYIKCGANVNVVSKYGETTAYIAAKMGLIDTLKCLINYNCDLSVKTKYGATILHAAAQSGNVTLLQFLLSQEINVNELTYNGLSPLHFALIFNNIHVIKVDPYEDGYDFVLLKTDFYNDVPGEVCLGLHSKNYNTNRFKEVNTMLHPSFCLALIQDDGICLDESLKNVDSFRNHHFFVYQMAKDVMDYMTSHKCSMDEENVNMLIFGILNFYSIRKEEQLLANYSCAKSEDDLSINHALDFCHHFSNISLLVRKGANINLENEDGYTPLHIATMAQCPNMMNFFIRNGANLDAVNKYTGMTSLHIAVIVGNFEGVQILLNENVDIHRKTIDNRSPLHIAVVKKHVAIVEYLLKNGANKIENYESILQLAAGFSTPEIYNLLLEYGTEEYNDKLTNFDSYFTLHEAVGLYNLASVKYLISQNVLINDVNNEGKTALHIALAGHKYSVVTTINVADFIYKKFLIVKELIINNVNLNLKDNNGSTPLLIAVRNHYNINEEEQLLENTNCQQSEDDLSEEHAKKLCHHFSVIKLLIRYGADVNMGDNSGYTSVHIAARLNYINILSLLIQNGGNVNAVTKEHLTPLHVSVCGYEDYYEIMFKNKSFIRIKDIFDQSRPLPCIQNECTKLIELCILTNRCPNDSYEILSHSNDTLNLCVEDISSRYKSDSSFVLVSDRRFNNQFVIELTDEKNEFTYNHRMTCYRNPSNKFEEFRDKTEFTQSLLYIVTRKKDKDLLLKIILMQMGTAEIVKLLLESGASTNVLTKKHKIPLDLAVNEINLKEEINNINLKYIFSMKYISIIKLLISKNSSTDIDWFSILHAAVICGDLHLMKQSIDNGADVNKPINGTSLLQYAIEKHNDLLNNKIDISHPFEYPNPNYEAVITFLIESGANSVELIH